MGTVEVETAESVNHLEAMAQWAHLGRARAPFHLYVPAGSVDIARRLAAENQVNVAEIWSYHTIGDQTGSRWCIAAPAPNRRPCRAGQSARARPGAAAPPARKRRPSARHRRARAGEGARRRKRAPRRGAQKRNSAAAPEVQPRQARLREHVRGAYGRQPAPRQGRGRASSTGSARRRACGSAARRSTSPPSA